MQTISPPYSRNLLTPPMQSMELSLSQRRQHNSLPYNPARHRAHKTCPKNLLYFHDEFVSAPTCQHEQRSSHTHQPRRRKLKPFSPKLSLFSLKAIQFPLSYNPARHQAHKTSPKNFSLPMQTISPPHSLNPTLTNPAKHQVHKPFSKKLLSTNTSNSTLCPVDPKGISARNLLPPKHSYSQCKRCSSPCSASPQKAFCRIPS